jgi:hypothetical protein
MVYEIWAQNMNGEEITLVTPLEELRATMVKKRLSDQRTQQRLADYYVLEVSEVVENPALSVLDDFLSRSPE